MVSEVMHVAYWQSMSSMFQMRTVWRTPWVGDQVLSAVLKTIVHDMLSSQV